MCASPPIARSWTGATSNFRDATRDSSAHKADADGREYELQTYSTPMLSSPSMLKGFKDSEGDIPAAREHHLSSSKTTARRACSRADGANWARDPRPRCPPSRTSNLPFHYCRFLVY